MYCERYGVNTMHLCCTLMAAEGRATSFVAAANGRHLCILVLNRVNVAAVTNTCLANHYDFTSFSVRLGLRVPSPCGHCALARKGRPMGLAPWRGSGGALAPQRSRGFWGGAKLPNFQIQKIFVVPQKPRFVTAIKIDTAIWIPM